MNGQINQLVKSLLQKETLEQCSVQELQQFADRHPFFGAAQLLLTKKLKAENSELYHEQLQKTFLFFHNPLWVENLLSDSGDAEIISAPGTVNKKSTILPEETTGQGQPGNTTGESKTLVPIGDISHEPVNAETEIPLFEPPLPAIELSSVMPEPSKEKDELLFEPYHTVDYFASQGIKIKEEVKPEDKFGRQLKSFTDWLKTMKRLPVSELGQQREPVAEQKVDQLAQHSIEEREVITEAMAEVWKKQGNREKAVEIYGKLSLLEPSKSAYFAAKIEELKKNL